LEIPPFGFGQHGNVRDANFPNSSGGSDVPADRVTLAVVITTYNHARFLAEAIASALAQTRVADKIIVVDDGSTDDPAAVVAHFPTVQFIRRENRGLAAARNVGLRSALTSHIIFLDADDRLLPIAIEVGLANIAARRDCAFVYGGHRSISEQGEAIGPDYVALIQGDAHLAMLRGNQIAMHGAVLYRCDALLEMGGFDEALGVCEDYDMYLRITQKYPIAGYHLIVAEYRRHSQNVSHDLERMYIGGCVVLDRHAERFGSNLAALAALEEGRANRRAEYARRYHAAASGWLARRQIRKAIWCSAKAAALSPLLTSRLMFSSFHRRVTGTPRRRAVTSSENEPAQTAVSRRRVSDGAATAALKNDGDWCLGDAVDLVPSKHSASGHLIQ
jgi:glycosyltransferase involved in cell wall biosynthesis